MDYNKYLDYLGSIDVYEERCSKEFHKGYGVSGLKAFLMGKDVKHRELAQQIGVSATEMSKYMNRVKPIPRHHIPAIMEFIKTI